MECNGKTGFTETLPEGKTETGVWAFGIERSESVLISISFPISFSIPLEEEHVHFIES